MAKLFTTHDRKLTQEFEHFDKMKNVQITKIIQTGGGGGGGSVTINDLNQRVPLSRLLTINGTTNQITCDIPAQDLSTDRVFTLSLPQDIATTSDVSFATINATTAIKLGTVDINTSGTLSNIPYLNKANQFSQKQTILYNAGYFDSLFDLKKDQYDYMKFGYSEPGLIGANMLMYNPSQYTLDYATLLGVRVTGGGPSIESYGILQLRKMATLNTYLTSFGRSYFLDPVSVGKSTGTEAFEVEGKIVSSSSMSASAFLIGANDINTTGTLSNVAYKGQNNSFTTDQSIAGKIFLTGASKGIYSGTGGAEGESTGAVFISASNSGSGTITRGADIGVYGNNATSEAGNIILRTGNIAGSSVKIISKGNANNNFTIDENGNVSVKNATITEAFNVTGNIKASGTVTLGGTTNNLITPTVRLRSSSTIGVVENIGGGPLNVYGGSSSSSQELVLGANYTTHTRIAGLLKLGAAGAGQMIVTNTVTGEDYGSIGVCGGGSASNTRGAYVIVRGNNHATEPGRLFLSSGNVTDSSITIAFKGSERIGVKDATPTQIDFTGSGIFSSTLTTTQFRLSALNTAPSGPTDTGTLGEVRVTTTAIYICTATNTWKSVAIA
jgi:hypothetical protein